MNLLPRLVAATAGSVLVLGVGGVAAASDYVIVDLGTIVPGAGSAPGSIGRAVGAGLVAGESVLGDLDGRLHAFVWSPGDGLTPLAPPAGTLHAMATAITPAGVVHGTAYDLGTGTTQAVRWAGPVPEELGPFELTAVAPDGTVVGGSTEGSAALHRRAIRWSGGGLESLPGLGGRDSIALAIAADGAIAGTCTLTGERQTRAVLWRAGGVIDLGTLGGPSSRGHAIASGGRVAGDADAGGGVFRACRFTVAPDDSVTREDLGSLGDATSSARGMNESGVIVGTSAGRAVIWRDTGIADLNALIPADAGWQLALATAIDDDGRITGSGLHDGLPRAFVLIPRASGDVDGDGAIGLSDLLIVLAAWGPCDGCPADLDGDGRVGFNDLLIVLNDWSV
jgi:probable HAF family extracellular repeat protein